MGRITGEENIRIEDYVLMLGICRRQKSLRETATPLQIEDKRDEKVCDPFIKLGAS